MKRFDFKLKNVLKYRETLENLAKNAYREALGYLNMEKQKLAVLEQQRTELITVYRVKAGDIIDPGRMEFITNCTIQLLALIGKQTEVIREKEEIAREKLNDWNEKRKDVKVIKRLEEKKWTEYLREADKEEQKFQDEVFIAKTVRGMQS